jgi:hypothetical protein
VVAAALDVPPPIVPSPTVGDACPEPFAEDTLPTPEIWLHITINVVSQLNAAEVARSLSVKGLSLWEFLLDQILSLQELLESSLVPHCVEELLARELIASAPLAEDIPSSLGVEGHPVAIMDAYPEPSEVDSLLTPEIWLHISINAVSHLNAVEEARSLSVEELLHNEFLLD